MLRKTALFSALLLAAGSPLVAGASAYEQKVKASLALIGYPVDDKRLTIAFGTGFCVNSSAAKSYYVTNNHVVTDRTGNLAPNLFLIQAKAPGTRLKATVLRHSVDPDLAIVAVDAPCDGTVKLSRSVPEEGDEIAIAGFPYVEVCEEAGLCSPSLLAPDAHKGKLGPILSPGHVNEAQEGTYSIIYDAKADHGNSGGPLFDAQSGVVYGIVVDVLPGYADEGAPPSTTYNRAIAMGVGLPFINGAPVTVALDVAPGGQRGAQGRVATAGGNARGARERRARPAADVIRRHAEFGCDVDRETRRRAGRRGGRIHCRGCGAGQRFGRQSRRGCGDSPQGRCSSHGLGQRVPLISNSVV